MSPLKIQLLLRMHAYPLPNSDLPQQQAFAPAMHAAIAELARGDLVNGPVGAAELVYGPPREWLTDKGCALVARLCSFADQYEAVVAAPTRPAPPTPATKPARRERPDYETVLRDDFAMAMMRATALQTVEYSVRAGVAYALADAMMAERSKAK